MARQSIFTTHAQNLSLLSAKNSSPPLKNHSQIATIIDALSRQEHHHVMLSGSSSEKMCLAFMDSLALHLSSDTIPKTLREADVIYFDVARFILSNEKPKEIEQDFYALCDELHANQKRIILVLNKIEPLLNQDATTRLGCLGKLLKSILFDEQWRIIVLTQQTHSELNELFHSIRLNQITESETHAILKTHREKIESFHHVIIPDETLAYALSLAIHYLNGKSHLDSTLELLDSGAARASMLEHDTTGQFKPILTTQIIAQVVSAWTQIPLTHLHHNKFKLNKFSQMMQQKIYGQESAIHMIGSVIQHACIKLQEKTTPLCHFIFAGPLGVGKLETVIAMTEHLFGHQSALLQIVLPKTKSLKSLADVKVTIRDENHRCMNLLEAVQQIPYAILLIENINQIPAENLDPFVPLLTQGYVIDDQGNKYDFRHTMIVITTTLGADRISNLMQRKTAHDSTGTLDLLQLVLNKNPHATATQGTLSPQELSAEIMPDLENYFSSELLQHFHIVPFIPLDDAAFEKIIRLKLNSFIKHLDSHFGIELNYAPECIKFLTLEVLGKREGIKAVNKLLEQQVYSCVAHEILTHIEDKNRLKHLMLNLNDTGNMLRCEAVTSHETTTTSMYTL